MKLFFASDHAGLTLRRALMEHAAFLWVTTLLTLDRIQPSPSITPDYGNKLAQALAEQPEAHGVAVCGTGIGISIALNRHRHVRAALVNDVTAATPDPPA